MATMKAVRIHSYGGPETMVYEDVAIPTPGEGDLLVRIRAAAVNPADWQVRDGLRKEALPFDLPFVPGWDFSGVIEAVGAACEGYSPGRQVYGKPDLMRAGCYAEYIAVAHTDVARKPASLDHIHSAAIPVTALTAWQSLLVAADLRPAQRVLIHAAAGGVGSFAVQLAKWRRAHVLATASARHHEYLKDLGADEIIDYTVEPFEQVAGRVDVVLDTIGGDTRARSWPLLSPGGVLISIVDPPDKSECSRKDIRAGYVLAQSDPAQLAEIARLADEGILRPHVQAVYELSEAAEALAELKKGHTPGKIVLKMPD